MHSSTTGAAVLLAGALALSNAAGASADYPNRPIRYIVPSAPGGGPDTVARLIASELTRELRQQIVVDNRPGAAGTVGMNLVVRAASDGYTMGHANILNVAIARSIMAKLPYDPQRDLRMVAQVNTAANLLVTTMALPVKSVPELIEHARRNPDKLIYAYAVTGSTNHLGMELFNLRTGTAMLGVAYKSAPQAIAELTKGQTQLMSENISSMLPHVRAGRVRALGVTSLRRSPVVPELPSVAETVPGFEVVPWAGVALPANVPDTVVRRLNAAINKALATPGFNEKFSAAGLEPAGGTPEQFAAYVESEAAKWADVILRSGIRAE